MGRCSIQCNGCHRNQCEMLGTCDFSHIGDIQDIMDHSGLCVVSQLLFSQEDDSITCGDGLRALQIGCVNASIYSQVECNQWSGQWHPLNMSKEQCQQFTGC